MGLKRERNQNPTPKLVNGKWWVRYTEYHADGTTERPLKCLGTKEQYPTKTKAEAARDQFMKYVNEAAAVTRFEHLCDDYLTSVESDFQYLRAKTQKAYRSVIVKWRESFAGERLDYLTTPQGRQQMQHWLNRQTVSAGYRSQLKKILSLVFTHAVNNDFLHGDNPAEKIRLHHLPHNTKPPRLRMILTPAQFMALMNHPTLPEHAKVLVAVMEMAGLRSCEALGLSWEYGRPGDADYREADIDLFSTPPKIYVRRSVSWTKNANPEVKGVNAWIDPPKSFDSRRTVPMPLALTKMILRFRAKYPIMYGWVFGSTDPKSKGRWWSQSHVHTAVKAAAQDCGFDYYGFGLHNHRHTARRNFKQSGADMEDQARMLGHSPKNLQQTLGYGNDGVDFAENLAPYADLVAGMLDRDGGLDVVCGSQGVNCQSPANHKSQVIAIKQHTHEDQILPVFDANENKEVSRKGKKTNAA